MSVIPFRVDELSLNIKILSCKGLLIGDAKSSDPYVKVRLGGKTQHKTKHMLKTLNPVFGEEHANNFTLRVSFGDLASNFGLHFEVYDYDMIGDNDFLGKAEVTPSQILRMAESQEPTSFTLEVPPDRKEKSAGSITLSMRHTGVGLDSKYWTPEKAKKKKKKKKKKGKRGTSVSSDDRSTGSVDSIMSFDSVESGNELPETKDLFIEIVSCKDLIAGNDNGLSDPYVKIKLGDSEVHKTAVIKKTLNPSFSRSDKNAYILKCSAEKLWTAKGIRLIIKNNDGSKALGFASNDELGVVKVSARKLYNAKGQGMNFRIKTPEGSKRSRRGQTGGSIKIRVRESTKEDEHAIRDQQGLFKKKVPPPELQRMKKRVSHSQYAHLDQKILLVELLSCRELLAVDKNGYSDPYVKFKMGSKKLHKTDYIRKTCDPVFDSRHNNSFVLDCSKEELFVAHGILVQVVDHEGGFGKNDDLGSVLISGQSLYGCKKKEYHLDSPPGKNEDAGYVTIRVREMSAMDLSNYRSDGIIPPLLERAVSAPAGTNRGRLPQPVKLDLHTMRKKILWCEIVACKKLLSADTNGLSDPYVKAKLGSKELHRTAHVRKTLNPNFTAAQNNAFVIDLSTQELFGAQGIRIKVSDWDRGVGKDDNLGSVHISAESLYRCKEEEYHLDSPPGRDNEDAGYVTIRVSEITELERDQYKSEGITPRFSNKSSLDSHNVKKKILWCEILSCKKLMSADTNGLSDPYVKAKLGSKEVHRTDHVRKTLNPNFTAAQNNAFMIDLSTQELFSQGLRIKVSDWDRGVAKDDDLGSVHISAESLYKCKKNEYHLDSPPGSDEDAGYVTIRVSEITELERDQYKFQGINPDVFKQSVDENEESDSDDDERYRILLVEVISCRELLPAYKNGLADPYVRAKMGFRDVHKTNRVRDTLDPVFTAKHSNSFVLDCSASELVEVHGIMFKVEDDEDILGSVRISPKALYQCKEEEYPLNPAYGKIEGAGYVTIRTTEISAEERDEHEKGINAYVSQKVDVGGVPGPEPDYESFSKPEPDGFFEENQDFVGIIVNATIVSLVVVTFVVFFILTTSGPSGRSSSDRIGGKTYSMQNVGEIFSKHHDQQNQVGNQVAARPQSLRDNQSVAGRSGISEYHDGCSNLAGWEDPYGYGCLYYQNHQDECDAYATEIGAGGKTPIEACCVCHRRRRLVRGKEDT